MELFLLLTPWMAVGLFAVLFIRLPLRLPRVTPRPEDESPFVSVVVPARNEETTIEGCVGSLALQDYPGFEVLVVDDQSTDRTAEVVGTMSRGNARELRLIPGGTLPEGWFGKPWACFQGAAVARGDLLLFTDADTTHAPDLLSRCVQELSREGADALTLVGRQVMVGFWEKLLQPQFFILLAYRFPATGSVRKPRRWRHAIANGQYLLFRRDAYQGLGGHEAVKGEVVEDLRLAQLLVRNGYRLVVRGAEGLSTRMYQNLGHLVEGWSKNVTTGALQATAAWLVPVILPLSLVAGIALWLVPPALLVWCLVQGVGGTMLLWSASVTSFAVVFWGLASLVMGGSPLFGLLYPLGSVLAAYIFVNSWVRGTRVRWKGRSYRIPAETRLGRPAS